MGLRSLAHDLDASFPAQFQDCVSSFLPPCRDGLWLGPTRIGYLEILLGYTVVEASCDVAPDRVRLPRRRRSEGVSECPEKAHQPRVVVRGELYAFVCELLFAPRWAVVRVLVSWSPVQGLRSVALGRSVWYGTSVFFGLVRDAFFAYLHLPFRDFLVVVWRGPFHSVYVASRCMRWAECRVTGFG